MTELPVGGCVLPGRTRICRGGVISETRYERYDSSELASCLRAELFCSTIVSLAQDSTLLVGHRTSILAQPTRPYGLETIDNFQGTRTGRSKAEQGENTPDPT